MTIQDSLLIALTMSCLKLPDWNRIIENGRKCVNKLFSSFYNKYNTKQLSKPRITNGIKAAIKVKNILYTSGDEVRYKHYRNKICTLIRWSKRRYYDTFFENNMANMKKTWQGINEL